MGNVEVRVPLVRDCSGASVKFNSALVPPFVRRPPRIWAALPWLYLKGIWTGDMREALTVLVGEQARGLSANVVSRLKAERAGGYAAWMKRELSSWRYAYWRPDDTGLRQEDRDRQALLAFHDFPAEHWLHLRTANPIESTFATVRHAQDARKIAFLAIPS